MITHVTTRPSDYTDQQKASAELVEAIDRYLFRVHLRLGLDTEDAWRQIGKRLDQWALHPDTDRTQGWARRLIISYLNTELKGVEWNRHQWAEAASSVEFACHAWRNQ